MFFGECFSSYSSWKNFGFFFSRSDRRLVMIKFEFNLCWLLFSFPGASGFWWYNEIARGRFEGTFSKFEHSTNATDLRLVATWWFKAEVVLRIPAGGVLILSVVDFSFFIQVGGTPSIAFLRFLIVPLCSTPVLIILIILVATDRSSEQRLQIFNHSLRITCGYHKIIKACVMDSKNYASYLVIQ